MSMQTLKTCLLLGQMILLVTQNPRCPVVLLLDTSGSMRGTPIQELNAGVELFRDELLADALASKRVEVAIVGFGPVQVIQRLRYSRLF
jgi:uncharacterized protein YegL